MKASLWAWVLQRITAAVLLVLVAVHFSIMHFVDPTVELTFASSHLRLQSALYFLVDAGLLCLGLFHGLNGIRNIVCDYWPRAGRPAAWVLGLVGMAAAGYGSLGLLTFLTK
jgi:succinate dehydrogenase / fumarate reductase, membrane anchor subunit